MIYIIFIISIFFHELGHIAVGYILGFNLKCFKFIPFGAKIEFMEFKKTKNISIKRILVYFSGPLMNFILCFYIFFNDIDLKEEWFYTNFLLGIFNLLPLMPLDGGKILTQFIKLFFNNKCATIISYKITKVFLCIFTFLYGIFIIKLKNISLLVILIYLWYIDFFENKKIVTLKKVYSLIEKSNYKY
ncbi:MAG: site-2 protease family protein [Clostridia bacterium]|nr:site-2 protease family protein [Clostridia bacterium]